MKNAAVITETRNFNPQIIRDHLSMLPDFELVVFCSDQNLHLFKEFDCKKYITSINSLNDYNRLLTSSFYWGALQQYDKVLIFQTDSKILREGIEEFYEFDYCGAPWKFQTKGGNGGLSLRDPKVMGQIIEIEPYNPGYGYEDVYFSNKLEKYGKLAPRHICEQFSCETIYKLGTWGYHAISNYMSHNQIKQIENQYNG